MEKASSSSFHLFLMSVSFLFLMYQSNPFVLLCFVFCTAELMIRHLNRQRGVSFLFLISVSFLFLISVSFLFLMYQSVRCFSDIEGNITNKSIYAFSFLVGIHREPQSINAKLFLPIIPIGIVAYALTLLWANLCRNSCINCINQSSLFLSFLPIFFFTFVAQ